MAAALLVFCAAPFVHSQENRWYQSFFAESSFHYYIAPGFIKDLVKPAPGFRAALGYEYKRIRFALESGYTHINGTNPLVRDFSFVPLALKAGYTLPIRWGLGVQADLGAGLMLSQTNHYENIINMIREKESSSRTNSPFAGLRLYGTYTFPGNMVKLYAGGGLDVLLETGGAIPLPLLEAGLSIKPLARVVFRGKSAEAKEQAPPGISPAPEIPPAAPPDLVFAHTPENLVVEETPRGKTIRLLNAVYFEANSVALIEKYRPVLDEAGERLRDDPSLRITLRAYAAPFGTTEGQVAVSAARAWFCMEYYMKKYGIAEERMHIEYYGAEKTPEWKDASWESYRCVELIMNIPGE